MEIFSRSFVVGLVFFMSIFKLFSSQGKFCSERKFNDYFKFAAMVFLSW